MVFFVDVRSRQIFRGVTMSVQHSRKATLNCSSEGLAVSGFSPVHWHADVARLPGARNHGCCHSHEARRRGEMLADKVWRTTVAISYTVDDLLNLIMSTAIGVKIMMLCVNWVNITCLGLKRVRHTPAGRRCRSSANEGRSWFDDAKLVKERKLSWKAINFNTPGKCR